ncbi:MAG: transposase [candidate division KSB1 bacterium]|nr:transposase [candidate division KSB1 bacterium]
MQDKRVCLDFDDARISSDGGLLMLRQVEEELGLIHALASVLKDSRHPSYVKHRMDELLGQRLVQIACGDEEANDCDQLRSEPGLKMFCGRLPETDLDSASQPTQSRFEHRISRPMLHRLAEVFVAVFLRSYAEAPKVIVLYFDDTEDKVYGHQQLGLFHGLFDEYCFMPLHVRETLSGH